MSNGEICCILGICCPPAAAREKLVTELQKATGYDRDGCEKAADFINERFALAPKSMEAVIADVVRMADHRERR